MGNDVPDERMIALLEEPKYAIRTCFLEGSVLVDSDLKRADVIRCICTFIFCDKAASNSYEEDCTTIMRAITIKKYVSLHTAGSDANIVLQLCNSVHRHHLAVSACGASNCQIICLDEIKMNLLGKSCICPGFSTVICNLMISASAPRGSQFEDWFMEYTSGCGQEIYCTNISPRLAGKAFSDVATMLYLELSCLLFAIEIVDSKGFSRVVLNPAAYRIPDKSPKVFIIATDSDAADAVRDYGYSKEELEMMAEEEHENWDMSSEDSSPDARGDSIGKRPAKKKGKVAEHRYAEEPSRIARSKDLKARLWKSRHLRRAGDQWGLDEAVRETVENIKVMSSWFPRVCACELDVREHI